MSLEATALDLLLNDCLHIFGETLLLYDHTITFGHEYQLMWRREKTRSTFWFFFHRYTASIGNFALTIVLFLAYNQQNLAYSKNVYLARQIMLIFNQIVICVILWLRLYALFQSRPVIAFGSLTFALSLAGAACVCQISMRLPCNNKRINVYPVGSLWSTSVDSRPSAR